MLENLSLLTTEKRNPNSMKMDQMSTVELITMINEEDKKVGFAVEKVLPEIGEAVDLVCEAFANGGRLFYVGAGTSGRLAVLDASECIPTFMTPPDLVQAVMAGGEHAFVRADEGSEDNEEQGEADLQNRGLKKEDIVVGITASGRTPYPMGALKYARKLGCSTVSLTCNKGSKISDLADCKIEVVVGPEILTGSTRLKAGTAHKMVLNMLSTAVMVKRGKVYENLMVDVHANNHKLRERAKRIVIEITGVSSEKAEKVLEMTGFQVKQAVFMIMAGVSAEEADYAIQESGGSIRAAMELKGKDRR